MLTYAPSWAMRSSRFKTLSGWRILSNVIGLSETGRDGQTVYLSTSIDHHSIVLRGGASKTRLSKLAFQVAPVANGDLIKHFKDNRFDAEVRTGSQPAINQVVRTQNPDGVAIELYSEFQPSAHPYSMKGSTR